MLPYWHFPFNCKYTCSTIRDDERLSETMALDEPTLLESLLDESAPLTQCINDMEIRTVRMTMKQMSCEERHDVILILAARVFLLCRALDGRCAHLSTRRTRSSTRRSAFFSTRISSRCINTETNEVWSCLLSLPPMMMMISALLRTFQSVIVSTSAASIFHLQLSIY